MMKDHNYFTLFDVPPSYTVDINQLKQRWYQLQKQFHPDNFVLAHEIERQSAQTQAALINLAYQTLTSPIKRAVYLLKELGIDVESENDTQMPATFLMTQMELRERIENGEDISEEVHSALQTCENELITALSEPIHQEQARFAVRKMMFYEKLNHA
jgi:molecular chaperone HscB